MVIFFFAVSDDNLSVQSSPWQRDHCWKQAVPRRNINRELEFLMCVGKARKMRFSFVAIRKRRRRPYDSIIKSEVSKCPTTSFGKNVSSDTDVKPQLTVKMEVEPLGERERLGPGIVRTRRRLNDVLQKLIDRRSNECLPAISSCRTDPGIVSPRKRILREMEKVSLEEMGNANKKYKAQTVFSSCGSTVAPCTTVSVVTGKSSSASSMAYGPPAAVTALTASTTTTTTSTTVIKSTNSHSISSILSRDEEQLSFLRNLLKSPTDTRPSGSSVMNTIGAGESLSTSSSPVGGVDLCDTHDVRTSRSNRCSTPIASSLAAPIPLVSSSASPILYPSTSKSSSQQLPPQLHHPPLLPMYIAPAFLYHSSPQPFVSSPPISNHPPYYPAFPAAGFRDAAPMWSMPPVSSLGRQSVYSSTNLLSSYPPMNLSPWVPVPSPLQNYPISENGTGECVDLAKLWTEKSTKYATVFVAAHHRMY